jgi:hypothetical protein
MAAATILFVSDGAVARPAAQGNGIASLTLSPSTIAGGSGDPSTGTVTLSAPAPAGGAVVTLTSSNIELAATLPRITVPAGQTSATFSIGTNAGYRRYSSLSFSVTISATHVTSRSAALTVTAQPRPADFNSGASAGANTQWEGLMCGGLAPIGGEQGILYDCSAPDASGFGSCTFQQECAIGCRRVPPNGSTFRDFCATTGPNPVAISRNYIVSGDRVPATIVSEAPAGQGVDQEVGEPGVRSLAFNAIDVPFANGGIVFPDGATTVPFEVATSYVPNIQFVAVDGFWFNESIPPLLITNGRAGQVWMAMVPPDPPPAVALPTLATFSITGLNPIVGGESTFGGVGLSGLSRAGGPTLTLTSSHPAIVPSKTFVAPVSENLFGFQAFFETNPTSTDTDVTVTLSDGRYSFSDVLTVRAAPPPAVLESVSVSPTSVVGGSSATGTVRLSAPQSGPTVVQVSIIDTAPATLPSNDTPCPPSSRCHNVTVPAGATSANFTIRTSPVTSQFNLNIFAHLSGSPGRQALLLITAGGATTLRTLSVNPVSMVGGASATATVTLTAAAPPGGAVVTLSKALANGGPGTVPVTIPASVTIPAGQTSTTFTVASSSVTASTVVRISATYAGTTLNADMSLFTLLGQVLFSGNVPGGTPAAGTVTLNGAAPSGGAVVALSSANTSLVTVPASVTVPAGQTSATFTAATAPVTQTTSVGVTASLAGTTVNGNVFLVVSRAVASVTLNPSALVGPGSSTATVTLRAASNGNIVVDLASSNTVFATVPFSVVVPSGQISATFTVNAAQVTETTTVVISATEENVTQSATLTINPSAGGGGGGGGAPGFLSPTSNAPDTGGDGNGFQSSPVSAYGDDAAVATDTNSGTGTSTSCTNTGKDRHRFYDFGFSIPDGSAIAGIEVRLDARADSTSGSPRMCVQLSSNGGATWTAAKAAGTLTTTLTSHTLGGAADTWGRAWSAADLTNANFRLRVINVAGSTSRDFFLDWVAVRPHFTVSGPAALNTISVNPTSVTGGNSSTGTVTLTGAAPAGGAIVSLASSNTGVAGVPTSVTVGAGATSATFTVTTFAVAANTAVTLTGTYSGTSRAANLTVTPVPPAASLQAVSINPTSVTGGASSTGTVSLSSAAPSGGGVVALSSSHTAVTVPASVTVPGGATGATFTAATSSVAATASSTITATYNGLTRTATLTVNPPSQGATLTVTATGRSGERVTSSPAGINVNVGTTGSASFAVGASITLSVTNGRDAIWSGACSSSGNKTRSCTFTLNGNASVTANVQ